MSQRAEAVMYAIPEEAIPGLVLFGLLRIAKAAADGKPRAILPLLEEALASRSVEVQAKAVGLVIGMFEGSAKALALNGGETPVEILRAALAKSAADARLRN